MYVLVACEESQRVCKAFRDKGHFAFSCDIMPCSGGYPEWHIQSDVLPLLNGFCSFNTMDGSMYSLSCKWDMIIAHPPCTYFSNATAVNLGRKDNPAVFNDEWRANFYIKRRLAFEFVQRIWYCNCDKVVIENVVGYLNTHFMKPTQIIQPFMFGEPYRKATCLWERGVLPLVPTDIVQPTCKWVRHTLKTKNDLAGYKYKGVYSASERSKTFLGIANAMADQWG